MKAGLRSLLSSLFLRQNKSSSATSSFMQCDQGSLLLCCLSADPSQDVRVWFWYWEGQNQTQNHPLGPIFFFSCTSTLQPVSKCPDPWGYSVPVPDFISCLHWALHGSCHLVSPDCKSTFERHHCSPAYHLAPPDFTCELCNIILLLSQN